MLHFVLNWSQFFCVYERWANNVLSKSDYFLCMCVSLCQHNTFITIWFVVAKEFKDCPKTKIFLKVIVTSIYIQTYSSSLSLSCSLLPKLLCDEILRTEIILLKIFVRNSMIIFFSCRKFRSDEKLFKVHCAHFHVEKYIFVFIFSYSCYVQQVYNTINC